MLRPRLLRAALPRFAISQNRALHHLPPLEKFNDGIPGLMTQDGFQVAWTQYQGLMLDKLNALTAGSADDYSSTPQKLLLKYARQPSMASLFNHASMAHNNHFFFTCLRNDETAIPDTLNKALIHSFGSIETLKREFVAMGNSMFGPGYVWLCKKPDNTYALLNTYIAGSPYPGAHYRRQARDMNTEAEARNPADYNKAQALQNADHVNTVGAHGPLSANAGSKVAPGGVSLTPVLCVSTWQHVYLPDWGFEKKQFLEAWWDRIDWNVVSANAGGEQKPMISS